MLVVPAEYWIASERRFVLIERCKTNLLPKILQALKPPPIRHKKQSLMEWMNPYGLSADAWVEKIHFKFYRTNTEPMKQHITLSKLCQE